MRLWCALAGGLLVLAAGAYRYASRRPGLPLLPADLAEGKVEPAAPSAAAVTPRVPSRPQAVEPIAVTIEPLELPSVPASVSVPPAGEVSLASGPGPRPEAGALRMPYADEEVSEFAILLQRAAEMRRQARPAPPAAEESDALPAPSSRD